MTESWAQTLARVGRAMGDRSRATFLTALMDGRAWTVTELAAARGVSKSTVSEHIAVLESAGLVERVSQGRHRYVRLAGPEVAAVVESMVNLGGTEPVFPRSLTGQRHARELGEGRTCYGHAAGTLGVALTRAMQTRGIVSADWTLSSFGRDWAADLGIVLPENPRRALCRPCLDWTERVDHLAGILADAVVTRGLEADWFERASHPRSLRLTRAGRDVFLGSGVDLTSVGLHP